LTDSVWAVFLLHFSPLLVFGVLFRRAWQDRELLHAALVGFIGGACSTLLVKYLAYPTVHLFLGIDLRTLIAGAESFWVRFFACVGVVGPIEETAKILGMMLGIFWLRLQRRPAAIFLAAITSGIGFAVVENLDYYEAFGMSILVMRQFVSATGHAVFSGIFGVAATWAIPLIQSHERKKVGHSFFMFLTGLFLAAFLHGIFNVAAFHLASDISIPTLFISLLFGIVILNVLWTHVLVMDTAAEPYLWGCAGCGERGLSTGRFCLKCGTRVQKSSL
jgi:RsiW-degrading membrane proteinase PrsW (M82 family)